MKEVLLMDIIGWSGSAFVVLAYAMISARKWDASHLKYQFCNLVGSAMLIVFTVYKQAYPPATVNSIWALIALLSIVQLITRKKK
ncbi:MAG: hypothetical protein IAE67_07270 [Candidatus Competibacteraceae bacterium]|nr:hypothetical protein [Candidatus Competibacteraceae bacterium]